MSITRSYNGAEMRFDAAIPVRGATDSAPRDGAVGDEGGVALQGIPDTGTNRSEADEAEANGVTGHG
jgi:hypothetical protein